MNRFEGKVAMITGAARGQGRSHALRLAREGAVVVVVDICEGIDTVPYELASREDLAETVRLVTAAGGTAMPFEADVRDLGRLQAVAGEAFDRLGRLDVVCANAGIASYGGDAWQMDERIWRDMVDVNLTGVWNTVRASVPHMVEAGNGGAVILISSTAALVSIPGASHYSATKTGLVGLARSMAQELAAHHIRVNTVHPTGVDTVMIHNEYTYRLFAPDVPEPSRDDVAPAFTALNALPVPWIDADDVSNAVLFLASDEARYVTGCSLTVDCGTTVKYPGMS